MSTGAEPAEAAFFTNWLLGDSREAMNDATDLVAWEAQAFYPSIGTG